MHGYLYLETTENKETRYFKSLIWFNVNWLTERDPFSYITLLQVWLYHRYANNANDSKHCFISCVVCWLKEKDTNVWKMETSFDIVIYLLYGHCLPSDSPSEDLVVPLYMPRHVESWRWLLEKKTSDGKRREKGKDTRIRRCIWKETYAFPNAFKEWT